MTRVFWDSMLFIYLLEGHKQYSPVVRDLLSRSLKRGDSLHTSYLSVAETLVALPPRSEKERIFLSTLNEIGFSFVGFDQAAVEPFRTLRKQFGLRAPDAMHLACAAAGKADLFLTGDKQLIRKKLYIPGIQFIADFESAPL